ncbi:surfeit locus protein 6-domain-containing protein [Microdochium trichocladiopsis]|uniref:Surfeit locus protein 6-domain-containing protein n=1 Tax=Microdochium trichocladiopsis TaxID=1682393 RepID=A0A9P8Y609_9PEZI|nr:surfeit locus protein 6-domain-containing protein [Microdochium trichocladiopsis]KAH7029053.1 surfeit locus protein 6-domain-containing protein [Microdochium trichocladiopsis]
MEESSLQERLQQHAKAFDGLLSLIPAKMYYGEDATDQWQRKKQTKEEAKEARRNKLDPNSELNRSVKEVMDEEARKKRKREQMPDGAEEDDWSDVEGVEAEKPRQGMKQKMTKKQKKAAQEEEELAEQERRKEEKKQGKKDRKAERAALREEEAEFNRRTIKGVNKIKLGTREPRTAAADNAESTAAPSRSIEQDEPAEEDADDMEEIDVAGIEADEQDEVTSQSTPRSPVFDGTEGPTDSTGQAASTSTSISSTVGPSEKPKHIKIPEDTTELRARLAAKIQALREARNADRNGKPIRTRQELIEARRSKQEERKAHKKELRRKAKDEADRVREEALASARNSPGGILSPSVDLEENNFSFGRIAFGDGAQLSHDLSHVLSSGKKKGPQDAKTALLKLENQKKRVQAMNEEKRKDVEDKELWLTAKRRAEGEKVRDDEKMLKKAIKRKDHAKKKSEKEWKDRKDGVAKSIHDRQKKREDNLRKRREEKMAHKAGGKKKSRTGPKKPSKGRAGFEGSFKVGGKKK